MSRYQAQNIQTIQAHLEKLERRIQRQELPDVPTYSNHIGKTDASGIAALTGSTPGSGNVVLYHLDGSTVTARTDQVGTEITVTAYNLFDAAVGVTTWVQLMQDTDGTFWVSAEQC